MSDPILLAQHPARNTPVQLSKILDVPPGLRSVLGAPIGVSLHVDDFSGSILGDRKGPRATRALVELARALLHAYRNPSSLTKQRMAMLAPQFDILLECKRPDDVVALWVYVISVFEADSPLRDLIVKSVSKPVREMYMTIKDQLLAEGQKIGEARGRALGKAQALLGVLEHRGLSISGAVRKRVLGSRDEIQLQRWIERAFTVASAEELFEPRRAIGMPSSPGRRARRPVAVQSADGGARARSL
jgi:hypothetical protein